MKGLDKSKEGHEADLTREICSRRSNVEEPRGGAAEFQTRFPDMRERTDVIDTVMAEAAGRAAM